MRKTLFLALFAISLLLGCKKNDNPDYEIVEHTLLPTDFTFERSVGADIFEDFLALWHTQDGINGSAVVPWVDEGKTIFSVTLRKTKDDVFPTLAVLNNDEFLFTVSPADTFSTFSSDKIEVGAGEISLVFAPDPHDSESGVNLYIKSIKTKTWKLVESK